MRSPILYSFRRCPYAMRARLAIANSGISIELREVVLKNKPVQLSQLSAKATVPVLQVSESRVIDESLDIMLWAINQGNEGQWLIPDAAQIDLITDCDENFKYWLDRYKYADRYPEYTQVFYREKCEGFLDKLTESLIGRNYLFDDQMSFADAAIFPFVRQLAHVNREWFFQSSYTHLQNWLTLQIESLLFKSIMIKYSPWQQESTEVYFP